MSIERRPCVYKEYGSADKGFIHLITGGVTSDPYAVVERHDGTLTKITIRDVQFTDNLPEPNDDDIAEPAPEDKDLVLRFYIIGHQTGHPIGVCSEGDIDSVHEEEPEAKFYPISEEKYQAYTGDPDLIPTRPNWYSEALSYYSIRKEDARVHHRI